MKATWKYKILIKVLPLALLLLITRSSKAGDKFERVMSLKGQWRFTIGFDNDWIKPNFDDSKWEKIMVPSAWENQGFHGYDGYGTYRKSFTILKENKGKNLYLYLGYIDDVDATYLNGHKIGITGTFPPTYQSAYWAKRLYVIPEKYLNFDGKNVITVQVYDSYQMGGIVKGEVGIFTNPDEIPVTLNLQGLWKFRTGDRLERRSRKYDDSNWGELFVPGNWEDQGYRDYDGYAWYRKSFMYKGELKEDKIVLILGKIDDVDEVYVNGVKVGSTGDLTNKEYQRIDTKSYYTASRGYLMDASILEKGKWNTISVRVYDSGGVGGIYEGPIGFVTQQDYIDYWRERKLKMK